MDNSKLISTRMPGFFKLSPELRQNQLLERSILSSDDLLVLENGLSLDEAEQMSENVIGTFALPFSVAPNYVVDKEAVLVPMVTEEPSIVAAAAKMAKICAEAGGFTTVVDEPIIKGQVQFYALRDIDFAIDFLSKHREKLILDLNLACPNMNKRGGGVLDLSWRSLPSKVGAFLLVEAKINVVDAMGANLVNTLMEKLASWLEPHLQAAVGLRILSNLCDERLARSKCSIPLSLIDANLANKMLAAHTLAEIDPYRACTHNKGILNGIDAVAIATGNDFRAIEAGAHAYAARTGQYRALTELNIENNCLNASICLPMAVGIVGGNSNIHRGAKLGHKILGTFAQSSKKLASLMASVGLSQCLAALYALCGPGIQEGHMKLHRKKLSESSNQ